MLRVLLPGDLTLPRVTGWRRRLVIAASHSPAAVVTHCGQENSRKKEFNLAYDSKEIRVHHRREAEPHTTGMAPGTAS